ncbi:MAG: hypothetical protein LBQ65_06515, partial [Tannerellaceae bacterium]|nr:hypothetical protein [Tannerellaceae bacterium]
MVSPKFLKISARLNSKLPPPRTPALDDHFSSISGRQKLTARDAVVNDRNQKPPQLKIDGFPVDIQNVIDEESGEYITLVELK